MKKMFFLIVLAALVFPLDAVAGTVSGTVRFATPRKRAVNSDTGHPEKDYVVVWLIPEHSVDLMPPDPIKMSQRNLRFSPEFVVMVQGQELDLPNDDDVAHNVYAHVPGNSFNAGVYPVGEKRSVTFQSPGVVDLYCTLHKHMHARVFVVPTRYFASIVVGGPFAIANVPAGRYTLRVWNYNSLHPPVKQVSVPKTGAITENIILDFAI